MIDIYSVGILLGLLGVVGVLGIIIWAVVGYQNAMKNAEIRKQKEKEEARIRWENMSDEEKTKERIKLKETALEHAVWIYGLPRFCPSCYADNYEYNEKYGRAFSKWTLDSTEVSTKERFDGATRLGGATTIHSQTYQQKAETYRCPKCGYKHISTR